jgi:hypothetical protein
LASLKIKTIGMKIDPKVSMTHKIHLHKHTN